MQAWNRHHQNCNNCIELCGTVDYILLQFHTKCFNTKCRELNERCDIGEWCLLHPHKGSTLNWPVTDPLDQTEMYQQQCRCNGPRGCVSSGVTKEAFVLVCFDALPPLWTIPKVMFCCIVPCLGVYYGSFYPEAGLDQTFITSPKKGIFHSPLSEHQVINNYCMFWFVCSNWSLCNWGNEGYCNDHRSPD